MNNILIVESDNDKYFIESLINYLNLTITVDRPICNEYECLGGLGNLEEKLISVSKKIKKNSIEKIGIILDADSEGIENRITLINNCIRTLEDVPNDFTITKINEFIKIKSLEVEIGCYITNKDGFGELETVLKAIASEDTTYADCLEAWRNCLTSKDKTIKNKDFDKFWVNNYLRFDTCTKQEQKQADKNCKNEVAIRKNIWDFENTILEDLKEFLRLLNS